MKSAAVTRIAADLCFFWSLFCLFSPAAPSVRLLALFAAACLIFGGLSVRAERLWLRLIPLLPPLALLLFAPDAATRIALGVAWLYFALLLALDRAGMEYWRYRRAFRVMAAAEILVSLYVGAALTMTVAAPASVLLFAGLFLLLSLHTLRAFRMGAAVDPAWTVWSMLELLVPCAVGGGLFVLIGLLFRHSQRAFEILFLPVYALVYGFTRLMGLIFGGYDFDTSDVPFITDVAPMEGLEPSGAAPVATTPPSETLNAIASQSVPWGTLGIVLAAVVTLVLFVLYLLRSRRAKNAPSELLHEERLRPFRQRRAETIAQDSAERIRQLYRSYLTYLELHGRSVRMSDTSADVLATAAPDAETEDEQELRVLYLRARYGDGGALDASDAARAEALLESIRNQA